MAIFKDLIVKGVLDVENEIVSENIPLSKKFISNTMSSDDNKTIYFYSDDGSILSIFEFPSEVTNG